MTPSELSRRRLKLYVSDPKDPARGEAPDAEEAPAAVVDAAEDSSDSDSEKTLELGAW